MPRSGSAHCLPLLLVSLLYANLEMLLKADSERLLGASFEVESEFRESPPMSPVDKESRSSALSPDLTWHLRSNSFKLIRTK